MTEEKHKKSETEAKNWVETLILDSNAALFVFFPAFNGLSCQNTLRRSIPTQGRLSMSRYAPGMGVLTFSIMKPKNR